ncbi:Methyltransferase domain-containing protein [Halopseudomonas sabulinigri]|uniref:Methyltransferase domain-containing protein n=1 Tax=Halopseudomonas sabulinigri TaxID=472181 RepID=A0A1H1P643_9GAMM|nr:methyltransferase domain-containing protein [Halopseudomonas sabulinigri]SDS06748.1 Methyltransferase domain-containing protein [Halopseudomonas sabulinigri]
MARQQPSRSISQADLLRLLHEARGWLDSAAGQMLLDAERNAQRLALPQCFGQHLVQYGLAPEMLDPDEKVMRHHWHLDMECRAGALAVEEARWPFAAQSLDAVVLHHGLDFSLSPQTLLREASQAVRAGGHLLIFGFNPLSAWGMPHYFGQSWLGQAGFVRPGRLIDWLELLGFAVEKRLDGCYRPPLNSPAWLQRLTFIESLGQQRLLPGGGFYCLLARRQMFGALPQRQRGMSFPTLTLPPLAAGTRRTHKRDRQ